MSVIRVKHQENYVVISKVVLEDPDLSFKAKGLWAYCMSRPNHWEFHVTHLATVSKDGIDSIYSAIKELETAGYIRKVQKNEGGKFGPVDYEVSEIKIILPLRDFPQTEVPQTENPALVSNDVKQVLKKDEKTVCSPSPVATDSGIPFLLKKKHMDGHEIEICLDEIFRKSVFQKKNWTTQEIQEAWKILHEYPGGLRDPFRFIEGTIEKIRNVRKAEEYTKSKKRKECQKAEKISSEDCNAISSVHVLRGQPFQMSLLDEMTKGV